MWPLLLFWDMGLPGVALQLVIGIVGLNLLFGIWRKRVSYVKVRDFTKGHSWCKINSFELSTHCSICQQLLLAGGMMCDSCGICINAECTRKANRTIRCKPVSIESTSTKHHWVKGNLPSDSMCHVCEYECGIGESLSDFRCCWCQWTVHEKCLHNLADLCILGTYRNFIIPPNCITLRTSRRARLQSQCIVSNIRVPKSAGLQWSPLIVIGNSKSGSNEACHVLSSARRLLNAVQSIDISVQNPDVALQLCNLLEDTQCRLLIAGGDGTIAWVLNAVQNLRVKYLPQSAILPLGTGNDLSRVLGWGTHFEGPVDLPSILNSIENSSTKLLDRWIMELRPSRHLGFRFPARTIRFNNYFSIGVDAKVTLNFHQTRQSPMYLFSHRLLNKLIYISYGTKDVVEQSCDGLDRQVRLYIDDEPMQLPSLQSIVFLNIDSWGAGVNPWNMGQGGATAAKSLYGDGIMEVMAVSSSLHIAQMQLGLSEPIRIGRGRRIRLILTGYVPAQADGEPWEQGPCEIVVDHCGKVPMLVN